MHMNHKFQLTRFFISSFYTKPKQPMLQAVLIIALFYLFMQLTVVNLFVYFLGSTQDFMFYNLVISNIIVFSLICYLSIATVFNHYEFNILSSLPLSYRRIASAKVISSLSIPVGLSMIVQVPTFLFLIFDGNLFEVTILMLFLPVINLFTALSILCILSTVNRFRYLFTNNLSYLLMNTVVVLLTAGVAIAYFISNSTIKLSNLLSQLDMSSISGLKDSLKLLLKYMHETALTTPVIKSIVTAFTSDNMTIHFSIIYLSILIMSISLYFLIIENISMNYLKNSSLENSRTKLIKPKAYLMKSRLGNYLQRELWIINSEAYFKMQVVLGILLPPVFAIVFLVIVQGDLLPNSIDITKDRLFEYYFSYAVLFMSCINNISGTPYSREGKYHYLINCMPFQKGYLYFSKVVFASIVSLVAILLSFFVYALFNYWNVNTIVMLLIVSCLAICYNLLTPLFDMKNPSTKWNNPSEAIKSNPNVLISLLFGMPIPIMMSAFHFLLLWFGVGTLTSAFIILPIVVLITYIVVIRLIRFNGNPSLLRS